MNEFEKKAKNYFILGNIAQNLKMYSEAASNFFKSLSAINDLTLEKIGLRASDHNQRFHLLKQNIPELYKITDKLFSVYRRTYTQALNSEELSILSIFRRNRHFYSMLGPILAIALGFDLVSREKTSGSLRSLLSHPVYRDTVINGKAIGGMCALGLAVLAITVVSIGFLMMFYLIPTGDELLRILVYMGLFLLLMLSFFAAALMSSIVAKDNTRAILYSLLIFVVFTFVIPAIGMEVSRELAGDPPENPLAWSGEQRMEEAVIVDEELERKIKEYENYKEKKRGIRRWFSGVSPTINFIDASGVVLVPGLESTFTFGGTMGESPVETSISGALAEIMSKLIVLIIFPIVMFTIAYLRFMRMDLR